MWKPLSIVSGVLLLAGAGITFSMVRPALIAERIQVANAQEYKTKAEKNRLDAEAAVETAESELAKIKESLTKSERDRAEAAAKKEEVAKMVEEATAGKEAASTELAELDQKLSDLGGLPAMVSELKAQEAKRVEYDRQISTAKSSIESAMARRAALDKQIAEIKRIDSWQQSGTMAPTFRSRVTAVNPDWGFVTIGAGNAASVVRQAKLDVVRGSSVVGKLIVTHVSPNSAAAEIVPGSVAAGDTILPGDQVRTGAASLPSNRRPAPSTTPPAAKPAEDGAPASAPAPAEPAAAGTPEAADPFAPAAADPAPAMDEAPAVDTPVEPEPAADDAPMGE